MKVLLDENFPLGLVRVLEADGLHVEHIIGEPVASVVVVSRAASAAFRKQTLPSVAEFKSLLASGVLIIEDGERATLNVIKKEQRPTKPGTMEYSSTTVAIPFILDNGEWKLAR